MSTISQYVCVKYCLMGGSFVVKLNAAWEHFVGILMSALDTKISIISAKFAWCLWYNDGKQIL